VRHRQPEELEVGLVEDLLALDHGAFIGPRRVREPDTLGLAGGAGGVDQGGQVVRLDASDCLVDSIRVLGKVLLTEGDQVVKTDQPIAIGGPVDNHDLEQVRQFGRMVVQLLDLLVVLGEDNSRAGVSQDVGDVDSHRRGVHRGGRSTGAQDG
jgi:hypothetical protein